MTTSAHDLDDVRTTIEATRADLAGTTAALAAKTDVKARLKAATATAATHVKDSTTGVTRRVVAVVASKAGPSGEQRAIGARPARVEARGTRREAWRARRAADPDRPRLVDRAKAWIRERKQHRRAALHLEAGPPAPGRLGDGW